MALSKSIETPSGAAATYWRIVRASFDAIEGTAWYVLAGYLDQGARDAGREFMKEIPFTIQIPEGVAMEEMTRAYMYADAKTRPAFDGATDS